VDTNDETLARAYYLRVRAWPDILLSLDSQAADVPPLAANLSTTRTMIIARTADPSETGTVESSRPDPAANRLGLVSLLGLSAWCGLVAGLFEVGTIVLRKQLFDPNQLYGMSREFVWLIPVTNL
jgi:hypothetical protein